MKGLTLSQKEQARVEMLNRVLEGMLRVGHLIPIQRPQAWHNNLRSKLISSGPVGVSVGSPLLGLNYTPVGNRRLCPYSGNARSRGVLRVLGIPRKKDDRPGTPAVLPWQGP